MNVAVVSINTTKVFSPYLTVWWGQVLLYADGLEAFRARHQLRAVQSVHHLLFFGIPVVHNTTWPNIMLLLVYFKEKGY